MQSDSMCRCRIAVFKSSLMPDEFSHELCTNLFQKTVSFLFMSVCVSVSVCVCVCVCVCVNGLCVCVHDGCVSMAVSGVCARCVYLC